MLCDNKISFDIDMHWKWLNAKSFLIFHPIFNHIFMYKRKGGGECCDSAHDIPAILF